MNPWLIVAALVALIATAGGGFMAGDHYATATQKAADQVQFDKIEAERTAQTAEANNIYRKAQDDIIALQAEREKLNQNLEDQREKDRKTTDDLRAKYAGLELRYRAESTGPRRDCSSAASAGADPASAPAAAGVQLPDKIASDLRQLTYDADTLRDEYAKCYGYAEKVR